MEPWNCSPAYQVLILKKFQIVSEMVLYNPNDVCRHYILVHTSTNAHTQTKEYRSLIRSIVTVAVQNPLLQGNVAPATVYNIRYGSGDHVCHGTLHTTVCGLPTYQLFEADQLHLFRDYYRAHYVINKRVYCILFDINVLLWSVYTKIRSGLTAPIYSRWTINSGDRSNRIIEIKSIHSDQTETEVGSGAGNVSIL